MKVQLRLQPQVGVWIADELMLELQFNLWKTDAGPSKITMWTWVKLTGKEKDVALQMSLCPEK